LAKNSGTAKILLVIGGLLGLFSILAYFIEPTLGAWWQVDGPFLNSHMSAFGTYSTGDDILDSILGFYGILGPILFIVGSICVLIPLFKDSKAYGFLGSFLMIGGVALFLIGLGSIEDYDSILSGLSFLTGEEYIVFFGSLDPWSWSLWIGFFMAVIAIILSIIGSVMYD
jgi:hypothetical protein